MRDVLDSQSPADLQAAQRDKIARLEVEMLASPDQIEIEAAHTFGPGFYARTVVIPAGATATGKVHATEHLFILTRGEVTLATEDGTRRVCAPFHSIGRPGIKRAVHAHTEAECTNVHITTETNLDRLEGLLIAPEPARALAADAVEALES